MYTFISTWFVILFHIANPESHQLPCLEIDPMMDTSPPPSIESLTQVCLLMKHFSSFQWPNWFASFHINDHTDSFAFEIDCDY